MSDQVPAPFPSAIPPAPIPVPDTPPVAIAPPAAPKKSRSRAKPKTTAPVADNRPDVVRHGGARSAVVATGDGAVVPEEPVMDVQVGDKVRCFRHRTTGLLYNYNQAFETDPAMESVYIPRDQLKGKLSG